MSDGEETYFACIDFEATCGDSVPKNEIETIEFPCVLVQVSSKDGKITNIIKYPKISKEKEKKGRGMEGKIYKKKNLL
jgi:inhibitor of KinA sporulation pathway (predicted exonuclease)